MILLALTILSPLAAGIAVLWWRDRAAGVALTGVLGSLLGAAALLAGLAGGPGPAGRGAALILPGLPGFPLRLEATALSALLSLLVAVIAGAVVLYAGGYMRDDPERRRFFGLMSAFIAAMQLLVLAGDWITLLAAWEMIGFASYLLIGFWYRRDGVASAATRAFLYTRSADLGLYLAIFLLIGTSGSARIGAGLGQGGAVALLASVLLLVAAMGKSAQVPLQDWLQRAMAGPTPVSALLHSATLVAAGAILMIRVAPLMPPEARLLVGIVGGVTTMVAGAMALAETDLKRLLAASTSSQYGLMFLAIGAGVPIAALLHLIAHAATKSALFLGVGAFQHDRQSTTFDGLAGAGRRRPAIYAAFAVAGLALAGMPPLAGFFSKDAIIASALAAPLPAAVWLVPMAVVSTVFTGAYMARALIVLWRGERGGAVPARPRMVAGVGILAALAAVLAASFGTIEFLLAAAPPVAGQVALALGLGAALGGLVLGTLVSPQRLLGRFHDNAQNSFALGGGMQALVARPALRITAAAQRLDQRIQDAVLAVGHAGLALGSRSWRLDIDGIDGIVFGLARRAVAAGKRLRRLQGGLIHREMALTAGGVLVIVVILIVAPLAI